MDKKAVNYTIVGVFVTLAFVAFAYVTLSMGGGTSLFRRNFRLNARFNDVKGLHQGSEVSLSGLRVGVVKKITVADDGSKQLIVQLGVAKHIQDRIRTDSTATVRTQGVLGDKYIELSIGTMTLPMVQDGDQIAAADQPDIFSKSGGLMDGISRYFKQGGEVEQLLQNLTTLSGNLANISGQIRREKSLMNELFYGNSGANLNRAMSHLDSILRKIDSGEGTLGSIVNDPTVYEDVKSLLGGAKRSSVLRYFMRQFVEEGQREKTDPKK